MTESEEKKLRSTIRGKLLAKRQEQKNLFMKEELEKHKLRKTIRKLVKETKEFAFHDFTGINVLEDLLKQVVPILEKEYKKLTTSDTQRKSFRAHILRSVQNLLAAPDLYYSATPKSKQPAMGGTKPSPPPRVPITENKVPKLDTSEQPKEPEKDPAFIDINDKSSQQKVDPQQAFQEIPGEDSTGRNFALQAFQKIQKQILEDYSMLDSEDDRDMFYDYLLTNLNLYFDRFEVETTNTPEAPSTPEYLQQKEKMQSYINQPHTTGLPQQPGIPPAAESPEKPMGL
mgnify:FL=1